MLTSDQAKSHLPDFTIEQIHELLVQKGRKFSELSIKVHYLNNLCARGDKAKIKLFLEETDPQELQKILNESPYEQWDNTFLHVVLYWNTGIPALEMFEMLLTSGAVFRRDFAGKLPWQSAANIWVTPFTTIELGQRNINEFKDTMLQVYNKYNSLVPISYTSSP